MPETGLRRAALALALLVALSGSASALDMRSTGGTSGGGITGGTTAIGTCGNGRLMYDDGGVVGCDPNLIWTEGSSRLSIADGAESVLRIETNDTTGTGQSTIYPAGSDTVENMSIQSAGGGTMQVIANGVGAGMQLTAADYIALSAGGAITVQGASFTMSNSPSPLQITTSGQGIEFVESDTNPACASGNFSIYADTSEAKLKKCTDGVATDLDTSSAGTVTGTGTTGLIPDWTGASSLGDSTAYRIAIPNDTGTGTTVNKLAKFTSDGKAIITATSETSGILGIVKSGAGTSGSAVVTLIGEADCVFDNTSTAGHFVGVSTSVAGDCTDLGTSFVAGQQVLGTVKTGGAAGTRAVFLATPDVASVSQGGGGGGVKNPAGAAGNLQTKGSGNQFAVFTATDDSVPVANGTIHEAKVIPNCTDTGGNHLNYTQSSNTFSCGTSGGSSAPTWWRPAASCDNATPAPLWDLFTSVQPTPTCVTGTNTQKGVLTWPDSDGDYQAQLTEKLPASFSSLDAKIKWYTSATSGDVVWQIATACVADAETDDPSFNTASTVTDTAKGTTLQTNDASITGVTVTGCAANELLHLKILRNRTHASDTLAATANLIGVEFTVNP